MHPAWRTPLAHHSEELLVLFFKIKELLVHHQELFVKTICATLLRMDMHFNSIIWLTASFYAILALHAKHPICKHMVPTPNGAESALKHTGCGAGLPVS
jgi:hypothetical protein